MTKLKKKVSRETAATMFERGKSRGIIVSVEPPDIIGFRLKGTRRTYHLPAGTCYRLAVRAAIEAEKKEKRKVQALRSEDHDIRLTNGNRWLVWDDAINVWAVYQRKPYQKTTRLLIETEDETAAVRALVGDEDE